MSYESPPPINAFEEELVQVSTTSGTFLNILSLTTPVFPTANYRVTWNYLWDVSNLGTRLEIRVLIDSVEVWNTIMTGDVGQGVKNNSGGFVVKNLAEAAHTIDMEVKLVAGGGTLTVFERRFALENWGENDV